MIIDSIDAIRMGEVSSVLGFDDERVASRVLFGLGPLDPAAIKHLQHALVGDPLVSVGQGVIANDSRAAICCLRLPEEKAAELAAIARADQTSVSKTILEAIDHLIDERREDSESQARLERRMADDREVLKRLAR